MARGVKIDVSASSWCTSQCVRLHCGSLDSQTAEGDDIVSGSCDDGHRVSLCRTENSVSLLSPSPVSFYFPNFARTMLGMPQNAHRTSYWGGLSKAIPRWGRGFFGWVPELHRVVIDDWLIRMIFASRETPVN